MPFLKDRRGLFPILLGVVLFVLWLWALRLERNRQIALVECGNRAWNYASQLEKTWPADKRLREWEKDQPSDPWGKPYFKQIFGMFDALVVVISSDGPDRKPATKDDVSRIVVKDRFWIPEVEYLAPDVSKPTTTQSCSDCSGDACKTCPSKKH